MSHNCIICMYLPPGWCGNDAPQTIIYLVTGLSKEKYFTEDTSDFRELDERGARWAGSDRKVSHNQDTLCKKKYLFSIEGKKFQIVK